VGLRNWLHNRSMTDPVPGVYRLIGCSAGSSDASYSTCRMQGVVTGPGVGPVAVEHRCTAPTKRWPRPGDELPVLVDRADPTRLRIHWDEVPTGRERAMRDAAALAQRMAAGPTPPADGIRVETGTVGGDPAQAAAFTQAGAAFTQAGAAPFAEAVAQALSRQLGTPISVTVDGASFSAPGSTNNLTAAEAQALIASGEPATAVVTGVTPLTVPQALLPSPEATMADLRLRVTRADGGSYDAGTRMGFRSARRQASIARVGQTIPVRVDPADPARVAIDVPAFDAEHGTTP
jgi:hypothetical protein